jgi:hypothetical protein
MLRKTMHHYSIEAREAKHKPKFRVKPYNEMVQPESTVEGGRILLFFLMLSKCLSDFTERMSIVPGQYAE